MGGGLVFLGWGNRGWGDDWAHKGGVSGMRKISTESNMISRAWKYNHEIGGVPSS